MKIKEWIIENIAFLLTLLFGAVALYTTFQTIVYRMDQVEARVEKFEELVITKAEFDSLRDQVNRIEGKLDRLIEK